MPKPIHAIFFSLLCAATGLAQANGRLQLHFLDVGQGDGAVVISPLGEVVVFDAGMDLRLNNCDKVLAGFRSLGIHHIDYLFVSHYHSDHIGCIPQVLAIAPLTHAVYDRGSSYTTAAYTRYTQAVAGKRATANLGQEWKLDAGTPGEVDLKVIALNGDGVRTTNENDLSLSVLVRSGSFAAEIGGDLSGENADGYQDIETDAAPRAGRLDVYKAHHHCSAYSSNEAWLSATAPSVAILPVGDGNEYGHPAQSCVDRLHEHHVAAYWMETGTGATPQAGLDVVGSSVDIEYAPGATEYELTTASGVKQEYAVVSKATAATGPGRNTAVLGVTLIPPKPAETGLRYAWARHSGVYHYAQCAMVARMDPETLEYGDTPPEGRRLHRGCPEGPR
jgi:beta-lactamase superfamily II metal-dependent hydrolase